MVKFRYEFEEIDSIKPIQLTLRVLILTARLFESMPGSDHCAVWGCDNDQRYPEKLKILPHVGTFRSYSPKNKQDVLSSSRAINRDKFKVTMSTKVCSNHFAQGYRNPQCRTPTLYMIGYDCEDKLKRPAPKIRTEVSKKKTQKMVVNSRKLPLMMM